MNTISKDVQNMLLSEALGKASGFAIPYKALCGELHAIVTSQQERADAAKKDKASLWDTFKKALDIAIDSGHSVSAMRIGLELACSDATIPGGSFRSYVNTLAQLFEDILQAKLTAEEARKLSIGDARARYRVVTPVEQVRRELLSVVGEWTADELKALVCIAQGQIEDDILNEVQTAAEVHSHGDEDDKAA